MKATRQDVYAAIDSERDYQKARGANPEHDRLHTIGDWLTFMRVYLAKAEAVRAEDWSPECIDKTLHNIRKVVAIGVAAMESLGAPRREGF